MYIKGRMFWCIACLYTEHTIYFVSYNICYRCQYPVLHSTVNVITYDVSGLCIKQYVFSSVVSKFSVLACRPWKNNFTNWTVCIPHRIGSSFANITFYTNWRFPIIIKRNTLHLIGEMTRFELFFVENFFSQQVILHFY